MSSISIEDVKKYISDSVEYKETTPTNTSVNRRAYIFGITEYATILDTRDEDGCTLLMIAIKHGDIELAHSLINKGVNLNLKNNSYKTALIIAAEHNNMDIMYDLLIANANTMYQDNKGFTALDYIKKWIGDRIYVPRYGDNIQYFIYDAANDMMYTYEHNNIIQYYVYMAVKEDDLDLILEQHCERKRAFMDNIYIKAKNAIRRNDVEKLNSIIATYPERDIRRTIFDSLSLAVTLGRIDCVRALMQTENFIEIYVPSGKSVLFTAVRNENIELIKLLVSMGIDINSLDERGYNVLKDANFINTVLIKELFELGINYANSPFILHKAVEESNIELIHYLISKGINVNVLDEAGYSILFYADFKNILLMKVLIELGADFNAEDSEGNSALDIQLGAVKRTDYLNTFLLLLEYNIDLSSIVSSVAETAIEIFAYRNRIKMLEEKLTRLELENSDLKLQIEDMELLPGGKEYIAVKKHYHQIVHSKK